MTLTVQDYLAKMYSSQALFRLLYEEGMGVLPPLMPDDDKHWPIESTRSQRDLSQLLGVSPSTVSIDLRRLVNWGWVQKHRTKRTLGHRHQSRVLLIADLAAEQMTGEKGIVSRDVLGITQALQDAKAEATSPLPPAARGTQRQWNPDES